jgi:opacity protein-like surface antigen
VIDGAATVQGIRRFGVKSNVALFNVYYDIDAHARIKPYVGVGLGFSRNTTSDGSIDIVPACVAPATCVATFEGRSQYSAAGALMAGFTAKLHDRLSLDAGYRFLYLGDAHTSDVTITRTPVVPGAPTASPDPIVHDLTAHEVRVGLRWDLR